MFRRQFWGHSNWTISTCVTENVLYYHNSNLQFLALLLLGIGIVVSPISFLFEKLYFQKYY